MSDQGIWIAITLVSLLFSALFSGCEMAFVTSDRVRVELDVKRGGLISKIINLFYSHSELFVCAEQPAFIRLAGCRGVRLAVHAQHEVGDVAFAHDADDGIDYIHVVALQTVHVDVGCSSCRDRFVE